MGNIVLLDDLTINKIAAGEVIERPASVVKEVVENSIDAGADNISIEIKNGGISYIRITDNGKGIAADDLEIAFERHATSKIRKAEDLETVKSMGFRGEALASIAAIARVELVTRTEDSEIGNRIVVEGGKIVLKEETGCPKGTSITIENLFYNTPVRYKFLKKDFTESGYIEDSVARIALVNPNIAIKLINSGKTVIQTSGNGDIKDIVYGIYGKDIAENIVNVEYYFEDMVVKGVIGKPSIARSNRSNQLFFVNKRFVKDKTLTSAAEQAFKGILPIGKYGFLILNLEIDPHKLDVNVHPAKLEVRFQEENKIFKLVYHAIKEALLKEDDIAKVKEVEEDGLFQKSYLEELGKDENNDLNMKNTDSESSESRGIGGFLKNILSSNKHEETVQEDNLVEQLYKDKLLREQENVMGSLTNPLSTTDNSLNGTGADSQKQEDEKTTSNLERLIKELDENLEKLNMQSQASSLFNVIGEGDNKAEGVEPDKFENSDLNVKNENEDSNGSNIEKQNISNITDNNNSVYDGNNNIYEENASAQTENVNLNNNNVVETQHEENNIISNNDLKPLENGSVAGSSVTEEKSIENSSNELNQPITAESKHSKEPDVNFEEMYAKMFGTTISHRNKVEEEEEKGYAVKQEDLKTVENFSLFTTNTLYNRPVYKYIGIVFGSYIVIEYEREMYIVNQLAANERILYEKVKSNYYNDKDKDSQLMLLPDIINLTARQMGIAKDNMDLLKKAGFDAEEFGENTIKLSGVPSICIDLDTKQLFLDILEEINTVARTAKNEIEEKLIATIACKAAKRVGYALTEQEVDSLMQELLSLPQPFNSPNGEPTAIRMSKMEIEKKFSRR